MTETIAASETADDKERNRVEHLLKDTIDGWKEQVDELRVQADLARLDARGEAMRQLDLAQNACLAATSKLKDAGRDATVSMQSLGDGIRKLLDDVKSAFEAARAVIERG